METIPTKTIPLSDGRLLEYASYGDANGLPAVFFHGFIGSHHQAAFAHEAARRHGLRLIAPNRPGVGRSTPKDRHSLEECVPDVTQLTNALGLNRFAVIGVSGGAPYALACLKGLPQRVPLAVLVSGLGPVGEPALLAEMGPLPRHALRMSRRMPFLVRWFLGLRRRRFRNDPEAFLSRLIQTWSHSDQQLFTRPEVRRFFLADLREVLLHGRGPAGMVQELQLYQRWGFRMEDIAPGAKVLIWHGEHDVLVPPAMSEYAARRLPGAEITLRPGGHFMVLEHADEVVQRMRSVLLASAYPP